jgi:hypothetical protein
MAANLHIPRGRGKEKIEKRREANKGGTEGEEDPPQSKSLRGLGGDGMAGTETVETRKAARDWGQGREGAGDRSRDGAGRG